MGKFGHFSESMITILRRKGSVYGFYSVQFYPILVTYIFMLNNNN